MEGGHNVNNVISEDSEGRLLLTGTFGWKLEDSGSESAVPGFKDGAKRGLEMTMKTMLELLEQGQLN